jgi:hypothetical protein
VYLTHFVLPLFVSVCQFRTVLSTKYFIERQPTPLLLTGAADLGFKPTKTALELSVMSEFYVNGNGDSWSQNENWMRGCPCDWYGVSCTEDRYTTGISLGKETSSSAWRSSHVTHTNRSNLSDVLLLDLLSKQWYQRVDTVELG